jgi:glutamate--cysteine ligase
MTDFRASAEVVAIENTRQLAEAFEKAGKPRSEWRIGVEHEKLAVDEAHGGAIPFSGARGIERLLNELAERFGWDRGTEEGRTVSLRRDDLSVTLEPGGQVEIAGAPRRTLHEARGELAIHMREIAVVGDDLGFAFLGLGIQPVSTVDEIELVPKARYGIMDPYMRTVGTLGVRMMRQTTTVQTNIDFGDERDAMLKFRTGMRLAPLMNAMFANSCVVDGALTDYRSFRGHVWSDTDRARCGLLRFAWDGEAGFDAYVDWALDVPAYFLLRDGRYVTREVTGVPFRHLLGGRSAAPRPTLDDWNLHLTTLFPEVRLKGFIEFRSTDSQPARTLLAPAALVKGVFYDEDCLGAAWDMVKTWRYEECAELATDAARRALAARMRRIELRELAVELYEIAEEGLRRQGAKDDGGRDERVYLAPAMELAAAGLCPADAVANRWGAGGPASVRQLVDEARLRSDELR